MILETPRTKLVPFSLELIDAASAGDRLALSGLGFKTTEEWPEADLLEALPVFRELILEHGVNGFNSWVIVDNETDEVIGSLGFLGNPDEDGRVELGFGVIPGRRRRRYCSESVSALIGWAKEQEGVMSILAHCDIDNPGSRAILSRAGFRNRETDGRTMEWELEIA